MKVNICLIFISILYIGTSIALIGVTFLLEGKTEKNPLELGITYADINQILNTNSKLSLASFLEMQEIREKRNLRVLMDNQECESYKTKIKKLTIEYGKNTTNINKVFETDLVMLHIFTYLFLYVSFAVLFFVIYFYGTLILSITCCSGCIKCAFSCYSCFVWFLRAYSFVYLILLIILAYQHFWGTINNFIDFIDCPGVNRSFLQEKYSDAIDAKNYMKICLYVLIINYIVCWFVSIYTGREKEKIREYRVQVTEVKPDNLGTLGNNLN